MEVEENGNGDTIIEEKSKNTVELEGILLKRD